MPYRQIFFSVAIFAAMLAGGWLLNRWYMQTHPPLVWENDPNGTEYVHIQANAVSHPPFEPREYVRIIRK